MTMTQDEITSADQATTHEQAGRQAPTRPGKSSRRKVLAKGLGVAAATVGAGVALGMNGRTAHASVPGLGVFSSSIAATPAVKATGKNGATGVDATSDTGLAGNFGGDVKVAKTITATDVTVVNTLTVTGTVSGGSNGIFASADTATPAVTATGTNGAVGVKGSSDKFTGVVGVSISGTGVDGSSTTLTGVVGHSISGNGVDGFSSSGPGVIGSSDTNGGVVGSSSSGPGVEGHSNTGIGVSGTSIQGTGVFGRSSSFPGVFGLAGDFDGNVRVTGNLTVTGDVSKGSGSFQIDHPLDPARKYLLHSFVESPDMKNIYDGVVALDADGEAEISLPAWFDALNTEFRYQLTCLEGYAPVYIGEKVTGNRFKIAGGKAGMEVSWQVTGIRQDPWANAHRILVEQDKPQEEQGHYLHPELYEQPEDERLTQR